jgi:hypothetical protein
MLSESKFSKYLLYGIGEVILVVIGILIALQINNNNQKRIKQEQFEATLVTIQNDIVRDNGYSRWLLMRYNLKDSIKNKILGDRISYDQLTDDDLRDISRACFSYENFRPASSGFEQLMNTLPDDSEKYTDLVKHLNFLYMVRGDDMDDFSKVCVDITQNYKDYLSQEQPWYAEDSYAGEVSEAQKEYYRNNPRFKNHIFQYQSALNTLMWGHSQYRATAMEAYVMINEHLGDKARELPDEVRTTSLKNEKDADRYIGSYELVSGPEITWQGKKIELIHEGSDLYLSSEGLDSPLKLLAYSDDKRWFGANSRSVLFKFEAQGENTLTIIDGLRDQTHWVRKIAQ